MLSVILAFLPSPVVVTTCHIAWLLFQSIVVTKVALLIIRYFLTTIEVSGI